MELTPIDILHVQFKRVMRGYNPTQVDEYLSQAASALEDCGRERAELRDKVEQLSAEVKRCRDIETTMNNALVLAQKTADELKANAHHEAELITREAEQSSAQRTAEAQEEIAALRAQIAALKEDRDKFESDFRSLVRSCGEWLDKQSLSRASAPQGDS